MAETLSYQEPQNVTTLDNLTPEEQDSLKVGEEMAQQEEKLYAGKYKDAQELEKAYVELQKKLGEGEQTTSAEEQPEEKPKLSEGATLITDASKEYFDNGNKLSDDTLQKFSSMSSQDLIKAYLEVQSDPEYRQSVNAEPAPAITDSEINQIKNSAGGEQAYANIINWSKSNLDKSAISAFDQVVETGSIEAIKLAVSGLKAEYDAANGVEGRMVTGKPPTKSGDVFRSQQELVRAMSDPRYDNDPAYRQDIIEKLDRSDLEF